MEVVLHAIAIGFAGFEVIFAVIAILIIQSVESKLKADELRQH